MPTSLAFSLTSNKLSHNLKSYQKIIDKDLGAVNEKDIVVTSRVRG